MRAWQEWSNVKVVEGSCLPSYNNVPFTFECFHDKQHAQWCVEVYRFDILRDFFLHVHAIPTYGVYQLYGYQCYYLLYSVRGMNICLKTCIEQYFGEQMID